MSDRPKVVVLAPGCDGTDVGESWSCFQWVRGLAEQCEITLLTLRRPGRKPASEQLEGVEVVEWDDLPLTGKWERLASMLKPGYIRYHRSARRWLKKAIRDGRKFDLIHQVGPLAMRYPCPGIRLGIPVIFGPLAGSLETPPGFQRECAGAAWYTKFRGLDRLRLRIDPLLRRTYREADVVVGVAPYVREVLSSFRLKRFELAADMPVRATLLRLGPDRHVLRLLIHHIAGDAWSL
ncbi:MAG: glycosyltransferase, partial [Planctomycetota bacterium]|nr:glycosyltransferase [Planctomycetota bacterium]